MPPYDWRCQVCDTLNSLGTDACSHCHSPATQTAIELEARKAAYTASGNAGFKCTKCECKEFESGEIRVSGSVLGSFFEVEGERFVFVSCKHCRFTEFYRGDREVVASVLDFIT